MHKGHQRPASPGFEKEFVMPRTLFALLVGASLAAGGLLFAQHDAHNGESVKVISMTELDEKLDGQPTNATVVEVTIEPGQQGVAHRHPGPAIVYVLEGQYELGIDDQPTKIFKAGETFYEPGNHLRRVSKNPAKQGRTRLIAVVLHPRDVKDIAVPEKKHRLTN
jgi:quercetin dioxygenase-like cupin family protein